MWDKIDHTLEATKKHTKTMNNHHDHSMAMAPSPIRKGFFENLYKTIAATSELHTVKIENCRKWLC
jgi:hypothetical protein